MLKCAVTKFKKYRNVAVTGQFHFEYSSRMFPAQIDVGEDELSYSIDSITLLQIQTTNLKEIGSRKIARAKLTVYTNCRPVQILTLLITPCHLI